MVRVRSMASTAPSGSPSSSRVAASRNSRRVLSPSSAGASMHRAMTCVAGTLSPPTPDPIRDPTRGTSPSAAEPSPYAEISGFAAPDRSGCALLGRVSCGGRRQSAAAALPLGEDGATPTNSRTLNHLPSSARRRSGASHTALRDRSLGSASERGGSTVTRATSAKCSACSLESHAHAAAAAGALAGISAWCSLERAIDLRSRLSISLTP
jgi:hypothetical protein